MDDVILRERLEALARTLREVDSPGDWKDQFPLVSVTDGVWISLDDTIGRLARDLLIAIADIQKSADTQKAWDDYAKVRARSQPLFRECIELLGGLAMRDKELEGLCSIADELIQNCAQVTRGEPSVTVPAMQEAFSMTIGRIIRLPFPEWTVWTLPFTAHEYGHVVLEKQLPRLLPELANILGSKDETRLPGLVADAWATYIMGPAYACAAIFLRLEPSAAFIPDDRHPGADTRAQVILGVLERMNTEAEEQQPYLALLDRLKNTWGDMLKRVQPQGASTISADQVKQFVDFVWRDILKELPSAARYHQEGWLIANELNTTWAKQLKANPGITPETPAPPESKLRDVLNAAWTWRLYNPATAPEPIARAALALCKEIVAPTGKKKGRRQVSPSTKPQAGKAYGA